MPARFFAWSRPGAHELTSGGPVARRAGTVPLRLTDQDGGVDVTDLSFSLLGIGDVTGIRGGAIRRRHPAPGTADMASELAAHVEFAAGDLPWRYSPGEPTDHQGERAMRPWLVLLAAPVADIVPLGRTRVRIAPAVLAQAPLAQSDRWAHVHEEDGGLTLSRVLSPCKLDANTACRAALVPAYRAGPGNTVVDAWTGAEAAAIELPLYDTWTFTTAEDDDFAQLAHKLHRVKAAAIAAPFGTTTVHVRARAEDVPMAGALLAPPTGAPPLEAAHSAELGTLIEAWTTVAAAGRWVLAPPKYDDPWSSPPPVTPAPWAVELRRDVRRRGAGGLGAWCAIDQQDQLAEGARRQAGALDQAAHDARMLGFGLAAGGSLFTRRLPPETEPAARLAVLGPLLRGMAAADGGMAADVLRDRTPALAPSLLSGAVRRMIRPGTALAAGAKPGLTAGALLEAANTCPPPERRSRFTEILGSGAPASQDALRQVVERWERALGGFAGRVFEFAGQVHEQARDMSARREPRRCQPVDLGGLATALVKAVDPRSPGAPAIQRVRGRYGLVDILPWPVFEPELDLPLAPVLSTLAPQWMLPGRGQIEDHAIVGLASNPRFIESLLAGANQRALAELRWRNVRVKSGWSPLRRFWPRPTTILADASGADITPIRGWAGALADASHRPAGEPASLLVFVIRSPILRRYPGTAIYLLKATIARLTEMATQDKPATAGERTEPIFTGALEPDLHYVGFKVPPEQEQDYAVVLEEPMAEPRFRLEPPDPATAGAWTSAFTGARNGARYAEATFHRRTIAIVSEQ